MAPPDSFDDQAEIRSVDNNNLSTMDSAMAIQLLLDNRDGRVIGKSVKTIPGSTISSGIYLQQLPESSPMKLIACREVSRWSAEKSVIISRCIRFVKPICEVNIQLKLTWIRKLFTVEKNKIVWIISIKGMYVQVSNYLRSY